MSVAACAQEWSSRPGDPSVLFIGNSHSLLPRSRIVRGNANTSDVVKLKTLATAIKCSTDNIWLSFNS